MDINTLDIPEIFKAIHTQNQSCDLLKGGYGLLVRGTAIYPQSCIADAMKLAAVLGIGVRFYPIYGSVAATHTFLRQEVVEKYNIDDIDTMETATIIAIIKAAFAVATSGKR